MIVLRERQLAALSVVHEDNLKKTFVDYMAECNPILYLCAGRDAFEKFVTIAFKQTTALGLSRKDSITTYCEILAGIGIEFLTDPQYYWLSKFTVASGKESPDDRMRLLRFHVLRYRDEVFGAESGYGRKILEKIATLAPQELEDLAATYPEGAVEWLESLNPEKCAFIGNAALDRLASYTVTEAEKYNCICGVTVPVLLGLMFAFGSGILRDPLYSWVQTTVVESSKGVNDLLAQTKKYFNKMNQLQQKVIANVKP